MSSNKDNYKIEKSNFTDLLAATKTITLAITHSPPWSIYLSNANHQNSATPPLVYRATTRCCWRRWWWCLVPNDSISIAFILSMYVCVCVCFDPDIHCNITQFICFSSYHFSCSCCCLYRYFFSIALQPHHSTSFWIIGFASNTISSAALVVFFRFFLNSSAHSLAQQLANAATRYYSNSLAYWYA